ncbi:MAG: hypothetical protein PUC14_03035 [Bacteroidales bacterium]|nr:hypothetical protein [Bacteroidales bacterium]
MNIDFITLTFFPENLTEILNKFKSVYEQKFVIKTINKKSVDNFYIQAYSSEDVKFILYSPKSNPNTTIMYANIADGYIRRVKKLSELYDQEYYNVVICTKNEERLDGYNFRYYSSTNCRVVLCYQDYQWIFYEEGTPLPFENVELYKSRLKKKRLNKEVILQYLKYLGWDLTDKNIWLTDKEIYEFIGIKGY